MFLSLYLKLPALGYILVIKFTAESLQVKFKLLVANLFNKGTKWVVIYWSFEFLRILSIDFTAWSLTTVYYCPANIYKQGKTENWRFPNVIAIFPNTYAIAKRT